MEESPSGRQDDQKMGRREAMALMGASLLAACGVCSSCGATRSYREDEKPEGGTPEDFSNFIDFEWLPEGPEDVYLFLFEQKPSVRDKDDDFIADAARLAGYHDPFYWHAELVYPNPNRRGCNDKWMAIGCRPQTCSSDFPVSDLMEQFRGYTATVRRLRVPLENQAQARKWFETFLQGQPYHMAGPRSTNCTDAAVGLGQQAGVLDARDVRRVTRDELSRASGVNSFLMRWDLPSVDRVMKRESIIFPNELKDVGQYMGKMQF